jgi:hypothetical protein
MKLKIDSFYYDLTHKVVKFVGYKDGYLLFQPFVKSYEDIGWQPAGHRLNLDAGFQSKRANAGRTRPILPPE